MPEVNLSTRQIELQCLGGQHYAHVPESFLSEGFGLQRHSRRKFFANEISHLKIAIFIDRHFDLLAAGMADDATRLNLSLAEIESIFAFGLFEERVPFAKLSKRPGTAQNAFGAIFVG